MPDQITKVGYVIEESNFPGSGALLDAVRKDSNRVDSLRDAVLAGANSWHELPGYPDPPDHGAKWTDPGTRLKYNVVWKYVGAAKMATTVLVRGTKPR